MTLLERYAGSEHSAKIGVDFGQYFKFHNVLRLEFKIKQLTGYLELGYSNKFMLGQFDQFKKAIEANHQIGRIDIGTKLYRHGELYDIRLFDENKNEFVLVKDLTDKQLFGYVEGSQNY